VRYSLDASFSEHFYGLKRRRKPWISTERATAAVGGVPAGEKLRGREIWRSLFFLVCVLNVNRIIPHISVITDCFALFARKSAGLL
jgi:hypothetical protein